MFPELTLWATRRRALRAPIRIRRALSAAGRDDSSTVNLRERNTAILEDTATLEDEGQLALSA